MSVSILFPSSSRAGRAPFFAEPILLALTLVIVSFSLMMVYSTTGILAEDKFADPLFFVKRQVVAACVGFALMAALSRVDVEVLRRLSPYCVGVAFALLILPFIPGIADPAGGAHRWIRIGPVKFQPGEVVKLLMVIFMAGYFARREESLSSFTDGVMKPFLLLLPVAGAYLAMPDFGSTAVVVGVVFVMAVASGVRIRFVILGGILLLVGAAAAVVLSPYRMARVMTFLAPMSDTSGRGYQLVQSLIALASGGVAGVGLGASQQKLFFLPAAHTDFIFAVIGEELGFLGCLFLIVLFLLLLWRGFTLASKVADDTFRYSLAVGLTSLLVVPALLNVAVVTGLLPTKGMVLPLVGYGGTSLIACLSSVGLLLAVARSFYAQRR